MAASGHRVLILSRRGERGKACAVSWVKAGDRVLYLCPEFHDAKLGISHLTVSSKTCHHRIFAAHREVQNKQYMCVVACCVRYDDALFEKARCLKF